MKKKTIYLAPLHGITDYIYRNTFSEYFSGIDLYVAPFVTANPGKRITKKLLKDILPENNRNLPTVPQIMGNSAQAFIDLANYMNDMGYQTVNWNLGCPYPMVAKKGRGCGLLPYSETIEAFLEAVVPKLSNRLSIKTRIGRFEEKEIFKLIPVFNQFPIEEIIIHPRIGKQMYSGEVNLQIFEECLNVIDHPVVYNGDIDTLSCYNELTRRFKRIDRWMIGRGVIMYPFLPWELKHDALAGKDRLGILKQFHDALFARYQVQMRGPGHLLDRMKGIWRYFSYSFETGPKYFKNLKKTKHLKDYQRQVDQIFEDASSAL